MYCRAGQQTEEEMYNNEEGGPAFNEFLDLLGQRVRLKGFNKYKAGLCNKSKYLNQCCNEASNIFEASKIFVQRSIFVFIFGSFSDAKESSKLIDFRPKITKLFLGKSSQ